MPKPAPKNVMPHTELNILTWTLPDTHGRCNCCKGDERRLWVVNPRTPLSRDERAYCGSCVRMLAKATNPVGAPLTKATKP